MVCWCGGGAGWGCWVGGGWMGGSSSRSSSTAACRAVCGLPPSLPHNRPTGPCWRLAYISLPPLHTHPAPCRWWWCAAATTSCSPSSPPSTSQAGCACCLRCGSPACRAPYNGGAVCISMCAGCGMHAQALLCLAPLPHAFCCALCNGCSKIRARRFVAWPCVPPTPSHML